MVLSIDAVRELEIEEESEELATWQINEPTYYAEQLSDNLYDEAGAKNDLYDSPLNAGLEDWEIAEAEKFFRGFYGSRFRTFVSAGFQHRNTTRPQSKSSRGCLRNTCDSPGS